MWFSDDGGERFVKVYSFTPGIYRDIYQKYEIRLDSLILEKGLSLTNRSIIRFQQAGRGNFDTYSYEDGFFFDNISINGTRSEDAPVITYFTPASGFAGQSVTVKGLNLGSATALTFNGVGANFTVVDDNTITTTAPAGATTGPPGLPVGE